MNGLLSLYFLFCLFFDGLSFDIFISVVFKMLVFGGCSSETELHGHLYQLLLIIHAPVVLLVRRNALCFANLSFLRQLLLICYHKVIVFISRLFLLFLKSHSFFNRQLMPRLVLALLSCQLPLLSLFNELIEKTQASPFLGLFVLFCCFPLLDESLAFGLKLLLFFLVGLVD